MRNLTSKVGLRGSQPLRPFCFYNFLLPPFQTLLCIPESVPLNYGTPRPLLKGGPPQSYLRLLLFSVPITQTMKLSQAFTFALVALGAAIPQERLRAVGPADGLQLPIQTEQGQSSSRSWRLLMRSSLWRQERY